MILFVLYCLSLKTLIWGLRFKINSWEIQTIKLILESCAQTPSQAQYSGSLECVWKQYYQKGTVRIPIIAAEEEEAAWWSFRPIYYSYFTIGLSECDMNRPSSLWLLAFTNKTHFTVRAHHENDSWWASMSCLQCPRHIKVLSQRSFRPLSVSLPQWHVLCSTKLCTSTIPRYSSVSLS